MQDTFVSQSWTEKADGLTPVDIRETSWDCEREPERELQNLSKDFAVYPLALE